jgi:hypothetical protein
MDKNVSEMLRSETQPALSLNWLDLEELGERIAPSKRGLTLMDIQRALDDAAPEHSDNLSFAPRGAKRILAATRDAMRLRDKADSWAENCALLYEEALARQWSSATDIPWETLKPLPDDLELAMCQLCTHLCEVEFTAADVPGQWIPRISADHFEVKLFLATQAMDEARHLEVFRKRALANGGGLMRQSADSAASGLRSIMDAPDFTEMSVITHVVGEGQVLTMFRMGEFVGLSEAEKKIFRLVAQDESRHVAFGVMHLKYVAEHQPWRREEIHSYLDRIEPSLVMHKSGSIFGNAFTERLEPLMMLLGGGRKNLAQGMDKIDEIARRMINEYMQRLTVAGFGERRERCVPALKPYLDPPRNN